MFQFVGIIYQATDITVCTPNNFNATIFPRFQLTRKSHVKETQVCVTLSGLWIWLFEDECIHLLFFSLFLFININTFVEISDRVYHVVHRDLHKKYAPSISAKKKGKFKHKTFKRALRKLPNSFRNVHTYMSHWHRVIEIPWNGHLKNYYYFSCLSILLAFMCVHHVHGVSEEARSGSQIPWSWN